MKKIFALILMSLAVCVNANAGFWYTNHHKADELRGTKEYYSNVYNDGGDYFKCYNDGTGNDYVMIGADTGIFDYENYKYFYSDYKYMYATIGFYKNGHLIERASFRFNLYSGDFDFAYSGDGNKLSTKIINHLKNVGDVRIIAPKYSGPDFDITIPMNPNLITDIPKEVKEESNEEIETVEEETIEVKDTVTTKIVMMELPKIDTPTSNIVLATKSNIINVHNTASPIRDRVWEAYNKTIRYIRYNSVDDLEIKYHSIESLMSANKKEMRKLPKNSREYKFKQMLNKTMKSKMETIDGYYFEMTGKYIYQG